MKLAVMGAAACCALAVPANAQEALVSDMQRPTWDFYGDIDIDRVEAPTVPGGEMIRVEVTRQGENIWDSAAVSEPLPGEIPEGQTVTLGFFARSGTNSPAWVNAMVGEMEAPYETAVIARIDLTPDGGFYCLEGVSGLRLRSGDARVTLHIGGAAQTVDLGPYVVTTRGPEDGASGLPCTDYVASW